MKLWKKLYFATLIVSLLCINLGIYAVFRITYYQNVETQQQRTAAEFEIMEHALKEDMAALQSQNRCTDTAVTALVQNYEAYYAKQGISLSIRNGTQLLYGDADSQKQEQLFAENEIKIIVQKEDNTQKIYASDTIIVGENTYYFLYERPLSELQEIWQKLNVVYLCMSVGISCLLAGIMSWMLKRMMQPVEELTDVVTQMQHGDYGIRVNCNGKDEVARLGMRFNEMADTICDNMQQIQQESENRQRFIDNLAHELKTPLTSILGFAEYLQKAKVSEEERTECLTFIMEESMRMKELSETLLRLAMLREDEISFSQCDMEKMQKNVEKIVQYRLKDRNVYLEWRVSKKSIYGNERLLESLLSNLILNGAFACVEGGHICITVEEPQKITVTDNGKGMDEEELKHIMEPFYRGDKARSRENGGNGLGLALCSQIVNVHKGEMTYHSVVEEGTTVLVELWKTFTVL